MPGTLTARLVGAGLILLLVLGVVTLGPAACNKIRSLAVQNRVAQGQLDASGKSGADAVNTTGRAGARERTSEDLTRSNGAEIRGAPGARDRVNSGVDAAGRSALCKREAYRRDPKCAPPQQKEPTP